MIKQLNKVGADIVPDIQIVAKNSKLQNCLCEPKKDFTQNRNYHKIGKRHLIGGPTLELPGIY